MHLRHSANRITIDGKYITLLDQFVLDFVRVLEERTQYVIVSGYVAILFGRSRGTEDVDILIPPMDNEAFCNLHAALVKEGYEFLNVKDADGLHDMLVHHMGIRVARKEQFIPNIELKFFKDDIDRHVFSKRVMVDFSGNGFHISPLDIQIAYKLYLGSPKDIEDALYLWEIFKDELDRDALKDWMKRFNVRGDEHGIVV
ncbi:MAG: hypothetical protein Q8N94_10295 [Methanoregula sp.]|nr:hypothetical protein [Methanoregula sp.]